MFPQKTKQNKKNLKTIRDFWLQQDLSMLGRVHLTKAEGVSTVCLSCCLLMCKTRPDDMLTNVEWKNKHHHLKKRPSL